ncbi:MAG: hypothetical protein GY938_16930 [Ketobacter sp.]|nr:hypothetical protein [Ketobacter sp.]
MSGKTNLQKMIAAVEIYESNDKLNADDRAALGTLVSSLLWLIEVFPNRTLLSLTPEDVVNTYLQRVGKE